MGTNPEALQYQAPGTVNAVLDSEVVHPKDPIYGVPLAREFVVPQESINANDPLEKIANTMAEMLGELKKIRALLEADLPPDLVDATASIDETQLSSGLEESVEEGINDQ